jgi:hypothetical protein
VQNMQIYRISFTDSERAHCAFLVLLCGVDRGLASDEQRKGKGYGVAGRARCDEDALERLVRFEFIQVNFWQGGPCHPARMWPGVGDWGVQTPEGQR